MTNAYRDDLEAALGRASDLEREVETLRTRVAELETGDRQTNEARENARRLAAALQREREELVQHHAQDVETEGRAQVARILGAERIPRPLPPNPFVLHQRFIAVLSFIAATSAFVALGVTSAAHKAAETAEMTLAVCSVVLFVIGLVVLSADAADWAERATRSR